MKSPLKLPRDQIEPLRPGDVRLYLTSHGWVARPNGTSSNALGTCRRVFALSEVGISIGQKPTLSSERCFRVE
jgi:hypothetical protein